MGQLVKHPETGRSLSGRNGRIGWGGWSCQSRVRREGRHRHSPSPGTPISRALEPKEPREQWSPGGSVGRARE